MILENKEKKVDDNQKSFSSSEINWFPGHMTKALRKIQANLKLVDIVAEIVDARIPVSSRNPDLCKIIKDKPRVILMNKSDMADPEQTKKWISYYQENNVDAIAIDCKTGNGISKFCYVVREVLSEKIKTWQDKGMSGRRIKVMVIGVPNVGKSSFINRLSPKSKAKTEDRPGVTRGNQWFSVDKQIDLLDTPGVLWPKFEDKSIGEHLAFTGAVKDQVIDIESLAVRLIEVLTPDYAKNLSTRFKLENNSLEKMSAYDVLTEIGKKRGMLVSGGDVDTERAAIMLFDEFRSAKLGKITLERLD